MVMNHRKEKVGKLSSISLHCMQFDHYSSYCTEGTDWLLFMSPFKFRLEIVSVIEKVGNS